MEVATTYPVTFIRKRVKYLRIRVKRTGEVVVSIPWLMNMADVRAFVAEKDEWIRLTRERLMAQQERQPAVISQEQLNDLTDYLAIAVENWRIRMGEGPVVWKLRKMKSQWGNCRHQRRLITFSTQLALADHQLIDYIIVHELAHLKVQNHGPAFHALVQQYIPDEKERRKRLRGIR